MSKSKSPDPFDRMRRDTIYGGYAQKLDHNGHEIAIRLHAETKEELQLLLPAARAFWKSRVQWFKAFREYAATELLSQLNGSLDCGQENPPVVTAAQLRKLLPAPFAVHFHLDPDAPGGVTLEMDGGEDEETLQENCFEVFGNLEDGITDGDVVTLQ